MKDLCPACGNESPCADHELSAPSPSPAGAVGAASAASSADPVGEWLTMTADEARGTNGIYFSHPHLAYGQDRWRAEAVAQAAERAKERTAREAAEHLCRMKDATNAAHLESKNALIGKLIAADESRDAAEAQRDAAITLAEEAATALTGVDEDQVMLYRQTGYDLLVRLAAMRGNK